MTANDSMESEFILAFVEHVSRQLCKTFPKYKHVLLSLDGHGSRNGARWLKEAAKENIKVCLQPRNTLVFLQTNDQRTNRQLKKDIWRAR